MRAEYNEEVKLNDVYLDKQDKCYMCFNQDICPLIGAIETHFVYMSKNENFVDECALFKFEPFEV